MRAAELTLELYGDEVFGFLATRMRSITDAREVFSIFTEDFWRGLPMFQWRASMRGWVYTLARNAANRYKGAAHNRPERNLTFTKHAPVSRIVQEISSSNRTPLHLRTEVKTRMRALRERLSEEDQILLMLRVDRGLEWRDLALVVEGGEPPQGPALEQASARVRKRFQLLKAKLRQLAEEDGLI